MICFRDMAWCDASGLCAVKDCRRNFNDQQRAAARTWWGNDDVPVAFADFRTRCDDFQEASDAE